MPDIYTEDISSGNPQNNPLAGSDLDIQARQAASQRQQSQEQEVRPTPITDSLEAPQEGSGIPGLTNEDLFPGMNDPIMKGMSSSQTLGSQPIFVASGQYLPLNVLNKRQVALDEAAKKRFERQMKFDPGQAAKLNNPRYQTELDNAYAETTNKYIKEAQALYGKDWDVALNSQGTDIGRRFATEKRNLNTLAEESNAIFTKTAQVLAAREKGGPTLFSPETIQIAKDVEFQAGEMANGKLVDLREYVDKLNGSYDLDTHLAQNKVVTTMKADINANITDNGGYLTEEQVEFYKQAIKDYAISETQTSAGRYYQDDIIKQQDIEDRLNSLLRTKTTKSAKMKSQELSYKSKEREKIEGIEVRTRNLRKTVENPKSDVGRVVIEGSAGTQFREGTILSGSTLDATDWNKAKTESFDPMIGEIQSLKQKHTDETFFTDGDLVSGVKKAISEATGKDEGGINVSYDDDKDVFTVKMKGGSVTLDLNDPNSLDELEKAFMGTVYGGSDFKDKNIAVFTVGDKNGAISEVRIDTKSPEFIALANSILNKNAGQDKKVGTDDVLDYMNKDNLKDDSEVTPKEEQATTKKEEEKPKETTSAEISFEEFQKTPEYKATFENAKAYYAAKKIKMSDAEIAEKIKAKLEKK